MQRTRPARTRWLARNVRSGRAIEEGAPASRFGEKLPTPDPDYSDRAVKVLINLMSYGSDAVRLSAAKAVLFNLPPHRNGKFFMTERGGLG